MYSSRDLTATGEILDLRLPVPFCTVACCTCATATGSILDLRLAVPSCKVDCCACAWTAVGDELEVCLPWASFLCDVFCNRNGDASRAAFGLADVLSLRPCLFATTCSNAQPTVHVVYTNHCEHTVIFCCRHSHEQQAESNSYLFTQA